ncbi:MAG: hypothetical protein WCS89_01375 [Candidatus Paceibacterota bacterium]
MTAEKVHSYFQEKQIKYEESLMREKLKRKWQSIKGRLVKIVRWLCKDDYGDMICLRTCLIIFFAFVYALGWVLYVQINGSAPSVSILELIWWDIELPFAVSRLWDIFLIPGWFFTLGFIGTSYYFAEKEDSGWSTNNIGPLGTVIVLDLTMSVFTALFLGTAYIPILFIVYMIAMVVGMIFWVIYCLNTEDPKKTPEEG